MKKSTLIICSAISCFAAGSANITEQELALVPNAKLVGKGTLNYLFWDIYDAFLYASEGTFQYDKPFALTLVYRRDFEGKEIAKRSIEEMVEQHLCQSPHFKKWESNMASIFPDVYEGDVLTGVRGEEGDTRFYYNGNEIAEVSDQAFTQCFFAIWLDEKTSEPKLRQQLLGASNE
ncbi:chalcone isomerase family protein [Alteromonas sp. ASW11-130]|uniref:chalcone isomerase family protein n=1 Tax=Alteromonas sp. ASW11-130 TaxID=3015775 RepID=UPI0022423EE9|nr:chalcone isomerase family protein [Alteromonas sp. ASW11-130]MCW8091786.1 chalcone isomerase family protein [Alteromonas sp. ASW11-130]